MKLRKIWLVFESSLEIEAWLLTKRNTLSMQYWLITTAFTSPYILSFRNEKSAYSQNNWNKMGFIFPNYVPSNLFHTSVDVMMRAFIKTVVVRYLNSLQTFSANISNLSYISEISRIVVKLMVFFPRPMNISDLFNIAKR